MQETVKSFCTKIVGVTKKNEDGEPIQEIIETLESGDILAFEREPQNSYDENAIMVYYCYTHIGYLNRRIASELSPFLDNGYELKGIVKEVTGGDDDYYGCNIEIFLTKADEEINSRIPKEDNEGFVECAKCGFKFNGNQCPNCEKNNTPTSPKNKVEVNKKGCAVSVVIVATVIILFCLFMANKQSNSAPVTVDEVANNNNATIANAQVFYMKPVGGLGIIETTKHSSYTVKKSMGYETLKNVIAIEVASSKENLIPFLKEYACFSTIDVKGNERSDYSSACYYDESAKKLFILIISTKDVMNEEYVIISGLDDNKNSGKTKIIFET